MSIDLAIVDHETLIAELLADYLSQYPSISNLQVYGSSEALLEAMLAVERLPDVVLADLRMPGMNGVELIKILRGKYPDLKLIAISSQYRDTFMGYMLKSGANAFVSKGMRPSGVYKVIEQVHLEGFYFTEGNVEVLREQLAANVPQPKLDELSRLTPQELKVLQLICRQMTTGEIAEALFVTKRTVEGHRANLLLKAGVRNVAGLIIWAIQRQVIRPHEFEF